MGQSSSHSLEILTLSPNKKWIESNTGTMISVDTVHKVHKRSYREEEAFLLLEIGDKEYTSGIMQEEEVQDFLNRLGGRRKRAKK